MNRGAPSFWQSRGVVATALLPLAAIFALLAAARRLAYRRGWCRVSDASVPVIVVGNVAVGGSGKTPVVAWLAEQCHARGLAVGIVSRGYGAAERAPRCVAADQADASAAFGDEPVLLARLTGCPVAVGADRPAVVRHLLGAHPELALIISDDGAQHYRMARAAELMVVDPATLGNGWLLPAGPLREPLSRLGRADLVLWHGGLPQRMSSWLTSGPCAGFRLAGTTLVSLSEPARTQPLSRLHGQRVHAFAGIGHPARFFDALRTAGLEVIAHPLPDHHRYRREDLITGDDLPILMTSKDAIKCQGIAPEDCWHLPVTLAPDSNALNLLNPLLERLLNGRKTA